MYVSIPAYILKSLGLIYFILIISTIFLIFLTLFNKFFNVEYGLVLLFGISVILLSSSHVTFNSNIIFLIDPNNLIMPTNSDQSGAREYFQMYLNWADPQFVKAKELFNIINNEYLRIHQKDSAWKDFDLLTNYILKRKEPISYFKLIDQYLLTHLDDSSMEFVLFILSKKQEWVHAQICLSIGSKYVNYPIIQEYFGSQRVPNLPFVNELLINFSENEGQCDFLRITEAYFLKYAQFDNQKEINDFDMSNFFFFNLKKHCDLRIEKLVTPFLTQDYEYIDINWNDIHRYFYVHEVYNIKFIPILLNYLVDSKALASDFTDSYICLHMRNDDVEACAYDFLCYMIGNNSEFLKNNWHNMLIYSGVYATARTDIVSYETNLEHYNNYLHTENNDLESLYLLMTLVTFSFFLFLFSLVGLLFFHTNIFIFLFFTELYLFSSIFLLIIISLYFELPQGQVYALLLLGIAAAEAAVGIGLLLVVYRIKGHLSFKK